MYESLPCSPKWSFIAVRSRSWIQDAKSAASKSRRTFASVLSPGERARELANQTELFISGSSPEDHCRGTYLKFVPGQTMVSRLRFRLRSLLYRLRSRARSKYWRDRSSRPISCTQIAMLFQASAFDGFFSSSLL